MRNTGRHTSPKWLGWSLAGAVLVLGIGLRLYQLGSSCFWYDEAQTLLVARLPIDQIALTAYRPPLYHFILHFWSAVVPDSEFWLRLPSLFFGLLAFAGVFLVAKRLFGWRTALQAALLAAISPVLVYYSQELRMYSLLAADFLAVLYLYILVMREQRNQWWLFLALWLAE
ncbi:MAG: glycosyltransferase family 39 protein, partial [Anaerolineae bacterium]